MFEILEKLSHFWLEIMTLDTSENYMGSVKVYVVEGRWLMFSVISKGNRINPGEDSVLLISNLGDS